MAKIQDEAGHGLYLYCAAETLGVSKISFSIGFMKELQSTDCI